MTTWIILAGMTLIAAILVFAAFVDRSIDVEKYLRDPWEE